MQENQSGVHCHSLGEVIGVMAGQTEASSQVIRRQNGQDFVTDWQRGDITRGSEPTSWAVVLFAQLGNLAGEQRGEGGAAVSSEGSPALDMFANNSLETLRGHQGVMHFNCTAVAAPHPSSHFDY